ncbi:hypothetical protein PV326_006647 [Microctonus aethiopoides]|uniref:Uncharacterized protein n=1 Tax=Microctonus aethiopoides TaxID=144406 RepID=A0AA39EYM4_9HYME|nr:hypothetical protein PV326_006647 [Microctonus aethiopoides]KAK0160052.1 hypothetical protein PV328_007497 [Microctonus aethiopoides]
MLFVLFCIVVHVSDAKPTLDCRGKDLYALDCEKLLHENHCPEGQVKISNNECREVLSDFNCPHGYVKVSSGGCHPLASFGN